MKKTLLTMAAALALVSCSQDDLMTGQQNGNGNGVVGVNTFVARGTRGVAFNNADEFKATANGFDLFAFQKDANSDYDATAFMNGVEFQYDGGWDYADKGEVKFWQQVKDGYKVDFHAVSPANTTTLSIGSDAQTIEFVVADKSADQVDLMYATTKDVDPTNENVIKNGVHIDFYHALSQVVFKAKAHEDFAQYITATVTGVEIANLSNRGTFTFAKAGFSDFTTTHTPWSDLTGKASYAAEVATEGVAVNADHDGVSADLTGSTTALLLMPQEITGATLTDNKTAPTGDGTYIKVTCKVYYKGTNDTDSTQIVGQNGETTDIYIPLTTTWQAGYKYVYTLVFSHNIADPVTINEDLYVGPWQEENMDLPKEEKILGAGTEDDPYIIDSEKKLLRLATEVNEGDSKEGKFYKQVVDLDLSKLVVARSSEVNWTPIGLTSDTPFLGTYDAENHSVKNLYIDVDSYEEDMEYERCLGLFGSIGETGKIINLTVNGEIEGSMSKFSDNYSFAGVAASLKDKWTQLSVTDNVNITISIDGTDDLIKLQERANRDKSQYSNDQVSYIQTVDIDLKKVENWTPIGNNTRNFLASYDGGNFKISNLTITNSSSHAGLFGIIESSSCVKNIKLENVNINTEASPVGAVCGSIDSKTAVVQNCHVLSGTITQTSTSGYVSCGGIAGHAEGVILNCSNNSTITGSLLTGGLAGRLYNGKIIASINTGTVSSNEVPSYSSRGQVGGLAGDVYNDYNNTHIIASINRGKILKGTPEYYGGIGGICANTGSDSWDYGISTSIIGCVYDNTTTVASGVYGSVGIITCTADKSSKIKYCFYNDDYEGSSHDAIYQDETEEKTASANCYMTSTFATKKDATNAAIAESLTEIKSIVPNFPYTKIELVEEGGEITIKCTE